MEIEKGGSNGGRDEHEWTPQGITARKTEVQRALFKRWTVGKSRPVSDEQVRKQREKLERIKIFREERGRKTDPLPEVETVRDDIERHRLQKIWTRLYGRKYDSLIDPDPKKVWLDKHIEEVEKEIYKEASKEEIKEPITSEPPMPSTLRSTVNAFMAVVKWIRRQKQS